MITAYRPACEIVYPSSCCTHRSFWMASLRAKIIGKGPALHPMPGAAGLDGFGISFETGARVSTARSWVGWGRAVSGGGWGWGGLRVREGGCGWVWMGVGGCGYISPCVSLCVCVCVCVCVCLCVSVCVRPSDSKEFHVKKEQGARAWCCAAGQRS